MLLKKISGIALLMALLTTASVAQTTNPTIEQTQTLKVNATLVNTLFTVADKKGNFITSLKKEDFAVFEDDVRQTVTNFSSETNLPLSIALLVDTSGSIRDKLKLEQDYATEFFYSALRRGKDRAMIISFDSGVDLIQDFTDDPEVLAKQVRKIHVGGGTSIHDAVYLAINEKLAKEADQRRKVVILISDGDDNSSQLSMTETLDLAQRNNVTVYAISTNTSAYFASKEQDRGDKTLKEYATETGGRAFFPQKMESLAASFTDIGEELRSQYTIGYVPAKQDDGTFRRIRIDVLNKNYKARHRTGYYAPKPG